MRHERTWNKLFSSCPNTFKNLLVAGACGLCISCLSLKAGHRPVWIPLEYIGDIISPLYISNRGRFVHKQNTNYFACQEILNERLKNRMLFEWSF